MVNILEKLKNCPEGTRLYSPLYGDVKLSTVTDKLIIIKTKNAYSSFNKYGQLLDNYEDSECMLFHTKEDRDWNTFCPFKDVDILTDINGSICIFKGILGKTSYNEDKIDYYCAYRKFDNNIVLKEHPDNYFGVMSDFRLSNKEEKEKFFNFIKENGYKWNAETKTLEKLITPKFKVGDKICKKSDKQCWVKIATITDTCYIDEDGAFNIPIEKQDEWELYTDKFDISTLIPFESKVLVRNLEGKWRPTIFTGYDSATKNYYTTSTFSWLCCIPYEENKHLAFTYDDCNEYYKTW